MKKTKLLFVPLFLLLIVVGLSIGLMGCSDTLEPMAPQFMTASGAGLRFANWYETHGDVFDVQLLDGNSSVLRSARVNSLWTNEHNVAFPLTYLLEDAYDVSAGEYYIRVIARAGRRYRRRSYSPFFPITLEDLAVPQIRRSGSFLEWDDDINIRTFSLEFWRDGETPMWYARNVSRDDPNAIPFTSIDIVSLYSRFTHSGLYNFALFSTYFSRHFHSEFQAVNGRMVILRAGKSETFTLQVNVGDPLDAPQNISGCHITGYIQWDSVDGSTGYRFAFFRGATLETDLRTSAINANISVFSFSHHLRDSNKIAVKALGGASYYNGAITIARDSGFSQSLSVNVLAMPIPVNVRLEGRVLRWYYSYLFCSYSSTYFPPQTHLISMYDSTNSSLITWQAFDFDANENSWDLSAHLIGFSGWIELRLEAAHSFLQDGIFTFTVASASSQRFYFINGVLVG